MTWILLMITLCCIGYTAHCAVTFATFNRNIRNWAKELDEEMLKAIDIAARRILTELSARIDEKNEENNNEQTQTEENE